MPVKGGDISEHLWRQDIDVGFKIRQTLNEMFATGRPPQDFAEKLQKIIGVTDENGNVTGKKYEAYRLLYNEASFVTNQADLDSYLEDEIEFYQVLATLDLKTSEICRALDECIFSTTKGGDVPKIYQKANNEYQKRAYAEKSVVVGINFPSFHVNCRTCTCPYIQTLEEFNASEGERAARNIETGKTEFVPDMTYEEWYKKYIASDPENLLIERKLKNESSDRIQYERYKERLGKDAPKSFAKFQDLKYTDIDGYEDLKGLFRYKGANPESGRAFYEANKAAQKLLEAGEIRATGTVVKPPKGDSSVIKTFRKHALDRQDERSITLEQAQAFINDSTFALKQWNGKQYVYYSAEGFAALIVDENKLNSVGWLDEGGKKLYEEVMKYVRENT